MYGEFNAMLQTNTRTRELGEQVGGSAWWQQHLSGWDFGNEQRYQWTPTLRQSTRKRPQCERSMRTSRITSNVNVPSHCCRSHTVSARAPQRRLLSKPRWNYKLLAEVYHYITGKQRPAGAPTVTAHHAKHKRGVRPHCTTIMTVARASGCGCAW